MHRILTLIALAALLASAAALAADQNWDAGVKAFQSKDYKAAVSAFQKYVEGNDNYEGHFMLGQALLKSRQYGQAASHLKHALELKEGDTVTQLALGQAYLMSGNRGDACRTLQAMNAGALPKANQTVLYQLRAKAECGGSSLGDLKKIAETKNDANSWAAYGTAAITENQLAAGIAALDRAVKIAPNDAKIRRSHVTALVRQARTSRGSSKDATYRKAVASAEKLVQLDRTFDNTLLLGEVQLGAKQYDKAAANFSRASSENASSWLPLFYLGQAYTALERFDNAVGPLDKALTLARSADDQKKVYRQLGYVYEKQKRYADSILNYQKAGDNGSVARVQKNQETEQYNQQVEEHNKMLKELEAEQEKLKQELESLPGTGPPPR